MTFVVVSYTVLLLGGIAALGILSPLLRRRPLPYLESSADPLEERRRILLLTITDLDRALESGAIDSEQHGALRLESEARLARLLGILDERSKDCASGDQEFPAPQGGRRVPRWVAVATLAVMMAVAVSATLRSALGDRSNALVFTGDAATGESGGATGGDQYSFFEARVAEDPRNKGALLDLAHRYLDGGRIEDAIDIYSSVLQLDRFDPEARAHLGFVLFMSGRTQQGLRFVEAALEKDPAYPEALFFKGVILSRGLDHPAQARSALRSYLRAAPFGAQRKQARMLLRKLRESERRES